MVVSVLVLFVLTPLCVCAIKLLAYARNALRSAASRSKEGGGAVVDDRGGGMQISPSPV